MADSSARDAWVEERVVLSLKVKAEKFKKFLAAEEVNRDVLNFLNNPDCRRVFIGDGTAKDMVCFATPPANYKKKLLYFLKLDRVPLEKENIGKVCVSGELPPGVLDNMFKTCTEVYLPLLSNSHNQVGWPEVIAREVIDSFHKLVATIYVTIGQTKGMTLLPLPPMEIASADRASKDKERVHVLETAVVTWTRQIKNVLKLDPENVLKSGSHPGPLAELNFWNQKAANLNSIQEQLQGEKIRKVVRVLDLTKSTYYPAFNRLCKEVAAACLEANDNVRYLGRSEEHTSELQSP